MSTGASRLVFLVSFWTICSLRLRMEESPCSVAWEIVAGEVVDDSDEEVLEVAGADLVADDLVVAEQVGNGRRITS